MTPQDKANSIFNIMYGAIPAHPEGGSIEYDAAKRCALIAVDEIIESRKDDSRFGDTLLSTSSEYYTPHPMYITYWLQVKQEIEKL